MSLVDAADIDAAPIVVLEDPPPQPEEPWSADRLCARDADCVAIELDPCTCMQVCIALWRVGRNRASAAKIEAARHNCPPIGCPCPIPPSPLPQRRGERPRIVIPLRGYIGSRAACVRSQCTVVE
jgi:hypothetical protein